MKIQTSSKTIDAIDTSKYTPVRLTGEGVTQYKTNSDGVGELRINAGKTSNSTQRRFHILVRRIIKSARDHHIQQIAISFEELQTYAADLRNDEYEMTKVFAENAEMANYQFRDYKTDKGGESVSAVVLCDAARSRIKRGIEDGQTIGKAVNSSRTLSNTPGGDMTPDKLAKAAQRAARDTSIRVQVMGPQEIKRHNMGGVIGVSQGSSAAPRFITMEYWGAGKPTKSGGGEQPIVLVGKGITFDTGGLNIKPGDGMGDMYMDMSGGAAVIHAITAAAQLGLRRNIVALIPAAENMISGQSYRPGDILTTMSGKTVEVLHTDAEGRLVMADAITYAKRYKPQLVVDVATLTGACLIALGTHASAVMTRDSTLQSQLMEWGEVSGDYTWPLPLWDEYEQHIKGTFADISNIPGNNPRAGGAIAAGMFLYQFAKDHGSETKWAHIDTASRMTAAAGDYLEKGSAGAPVRLLVTLLKNYHAQ